MYDKIQRKLKLQLYFGVLENFSPSTMKSRCCVQTFFIQMVSAYFIIISRSNYLFARLF